MSSRIVAELALLLWLPLTLVLFRGLRPPLAAALGLFGAALLLPFGVGFDAKGMPALGKEEIGSIAVLLGGMASCRRRLKAARPGRGLDALVVILLFAAIGTSLTNQDPLAYGSVVLPKVKLYDGVSMALKDVLRFGIPFFLGRALFRSSRELRLLLTILAGVGLFYSLFILIEVRLSPQFHNWVYGFHFKVFRQAIRYGGYRPRVFMYSGLAVAVLACVTLIAAITLGRARLSIDRIPARLAVPYLGFVVAVCKSFAAIAYSVFIGAVVALFRPRVQMRVAVLLCAIVLSYPVLRMADLFPTDGLVTLARSVDEGRAASLDFRFQQEKLLLAHAQKRLLFGWGEFARSRVYDPATGASESVVDGWWINILGRRGLVGWGAFFGLLVLPVLLAWRNFDRIPSRRDRILVAGLSLIVAVYAVDLLPNGFFTNVPLFLSGALGGLASALASEKSARRRVRTGRGRSARPLEDPGAAPAPEPRAAHPARAGLSALLGPGGRASRGGGSR